MAKEPYFLCQLNQSNETGYAMVFKYPPINGTKKFDHFWFVFTALILVGNFLVLLWRFSRSKEHRWTIPSILVINLALSDFLLGVQMSVYLFLTSWSCAVFKRKDVSSTLCGISAALQVTSVILSGLVTVTIAAFYTIALFGLCCLGQPQCTRKIATIFLVVEWILAAGAGIAYQQNNPTYPFSKPQLSNSSNKYLIAFVSEGCLPMTGFFHAKHVYKPNVVIGSVVLFFLVLAAVSYAVMLRRLQGQTQAVDAVSIRGIGVRLIVIAFFSLACWIAYIPLTLEKRYYYCLIVLSFAAIFNPLIFTILSKPFFISVRQLWICVRFKCGRAVQLRDLSSLHKDPLLTDVPPETNQTVPYGAIQA